MSEVQLKILFVDDNPDLFSFFEAVAEAVDMQPFFAQDGLEAVTVCELHGHEIAAIVSDYKMPQLDGFEFREAVKKGYASIPFFLSSGHISKDLAMKALDLGIKGLLYKPYSEEEIVKLLKEKCVERIEEIYEDFEMKSEFQNDARTLARDVEDLLIEFEAAPSDLERVNGIMRLLHTIKGTAACLGLTDLSSFTHHYEDFFGPISRREKTAGNNFISASLKALDTLNLLIDQMTVPGKSHFDVGKATRIFDLDSSELDQGAPKTEVEKSAPSDTPAHQEKEEEISVSISLLDEFMEQSGELTVLKSMIVKQVQSLERDYGQSETLERLVESLEEMNQVSGSIQNKIVEIRKVPVKNVLRQLPRVARDTCRATGKDVKLEMSGQGLRVDQSIGDAMQNVLVHMVRNSIDHGVEPPDQRAESGKTATGQVNVDCKEENESVIVRVTDDGGGVHPDKIRSIALKKELYTQEELESMSDQRAQEIIFEPGFSTAETVTDISGRGVGMDMVASTVKNLGGQFKLSSTVGKGSEIKLIFPIPKSVLIIRALFVEFGGSIFSINQEDIERVVLLDTSEIKKKIRSVEKKRFFEFDGTLIPVIDLAKEFSLQTPQKDTQEQRLVVLKSGEYFFAIQVDQIHENDEIVVKNIDQRLRSINVFSGATFLGDGRVALVLDTSGLVKHLDIRSDLNSTNKQSLKSVDSESSNHKISGEQFLTFCSFDKRISAVSLSKVFRLETFKKSQIEYIHQQPTIHYLNKPMPLFDYNKALDLGNVPDEFHTIIHFQNQTPVAFVIEEVLEIFEAQTAIDQSLASGQILGSLLFEGKTVEILDLENIISKRTPPSSTDIRVSA